MKKNGKKYPWIKSIFRRKKRKDQASAVYAGPEMMNPVGTEKPVYAGPDYFGGGESNKIYAGPERLAGKPDDDDRPVEDVYAGPEFFERPAPDGEEPEDFPGDTTIDDEEEDGFTFDEPTDEDDGPYTDGPALLTYAGPEYSPPPAIEPVMCVYAGPEYWNPRNGEPIGAAPPPETPENKPDIPEGDGVTCPACGAVLIEGSEFCHECGMPVKKPEKKDE